MLGNDNRANVFMFYKSGPNEPIQCTSIQNMYLANWTAWQTKAGRTMFAFVRPAARILLLSIPAIVRLSSVNCCKEIFDSNTGMAALH
jgi:hypothetical protein